MVWIGSESPGFGEFSLFRIGENVEVAHCDPSEVFAGFRASFGGSVGVVDLGTEEVHYPAVVRFDFHIPHYGPVVLASADFLGSADCRRITHTPHRLVFQTLRRQREPCVCSFPASSP